MRRVNLGPAALVDKLNLDIFRTSEEIVHNVRTNPKRAHLLICFYSICAAFARKAAADGAAAVTPLISILLFLEPEVTMFGGDDETLNYQETWLAWRSHRLFGCTDASNRYWLVSAK